MALKYVLLATAFLAASCANLGTPGASARAGRDCFLNSEINGWNVIDPHTVRVTISPNRNYALSVPTNTSDLNFSQTILVRSRGSDWICTGTGNDVRITVAGNIPHTWWVTSVTRLPQDQPAQPAATPATPQGS